MGETCLNLSKVLAPPKDALNIDVADDDAGFVHILEIQINAVTESENQTATEQVTNTFVILSESAEAPDPACYADLTLTEQTLEGVGNINEPEGDTILLRAITGNQTIVETEQPDGSVTSVSTGGVNDDPLVAVNRAITTDSLSEFNVVQGGTSGGTSGGNTGV